jgi:hypothetical protein
MNSLRPEDFVKVPSGGKFNPYGIDEHNRSSAYEIFPQWFGAVGEYRIRFVYSTDSERLSDWLGDLGQVSPGKLGELFKQVPKGKVMSNEVKVTVVKAK